LSGASHGKLLEYPIFLIVLNGVYNIDVVIKTNYMKGKWAHIATICVKKILNQSNA
jgi:hypothetical protein